MSKFLRWDQSEELELSPCPFCGGEPIAIHRGNERTKIRHLIIKCPACRIMREDSALRHGFVWLENIAVAAWNSRTGEA